MRFLRYAAVGALALLCMLSARTSAHAQASAALSGFVSGIDGKAVSGALVRVTGQNITLTTATDSAGRFAFETLTVGTYILEVVKGTLDAKRSIELGIGGLDISIPLVEYKTIGSVTASRTPAAARSGTDVTLGAAMLSRMPGATGLPGILLQLPSAARGSNGQIHINGDHNGLNYYLDGVQLPSNLNTVMGNAIDPSDIGFMDALEGAYPAQYGDRFAAVLNIGARAYAGGPAVSADVNAGSFGQSSGTFGYHVGFEDGAALSFTSQISQTGRGLEPAVPDAPHNRGSDANQFLRFNAPVHGTDSLNLDVIHSLQTFQIPPDLSNGVPAETDDNEMQNSTFVSLQYRHAVGAHGSISFGPSLKVSHVLDTNDLANDLAPAAGSSCTDFSDCGFFSVYADRISRDYRFATDYALKSQRHDVRGGILYGSTVVDKNYAITLQSGNALDPSGGTFTAIDTSPNVGHELEAYAQDSWKMGSLYQLDYGFRMDAFQVFSTDFNDGFSQWSPRVKLTRNLGAHASVYAYYGRLFEPFSVESVSPATAAKLYTAADSPGAVFDLRPERDSLYEAGGHVMLGSTEIGLRLSHRVAADWIDDTQVGATNLHQDINFPQGRVDLQSLYIQHLLPGAGRVYMSLTHSLARNSANCETQLLQNCAAAGAPGGPLVPADHDQRWDGNAGVVVNDARGGWFAADAEYGSGLSGVPPHLTFDVT